MIIPGTDEVMRLELITMGWNEVVKVAINDVLSVN